MCECVDQARGVGGDDIWCFVEVLVGVGMDSLVSYLMSDGEGGAQSNVFTDTAALLRVAGTIELSNAWEGVREGGRGRREGGREGGDTLWNRD